MANTLAAPAGEAWRWRPGQTVLRASSAVLGGTPTLDMIHRVTLLVYVRSLNQLRLQRSDARVWLSAEECASRLSFETREIVWRLQNLQSAGYVEYAPCVRRNAREVYDLAPTMAQLESMEDLAACVTEAETGL